MNQRRRGRKVTSVSTTVKSIVHRPRVLEVLFFSRLNRKGILGVGDPGAVSRVRRKGATKVSEDAETGNRPRKASSTQGKSIVADMWEYPLGPLYLHGTCNPKYLTRTVLIFSTWHVMTRRVCLIGTIIGQQPEFLA